MAVTICYPTPGANVPGGGGFFTWGLVANDSVTGASASWNAPPSPVTGQTVPAPAPCNWAFEFANVAIGTDITMTIQTGSGIQVSVTFQCLGHAK